MWADLGVEVGASALAGASAALGILNQSPLDSGSCSSTTSKVQQSQRTGEASSDIRRRIKSLGAEFLTGMADIAAGLGVSKAKGVDVTQGKGAIQIRVRGNMYNMCAEDAQSDSPTRASSEGRGVAHSLREARDPKVDVRCACHEIGQRFNMKTPVPTTTDWTRLRRFGELFEAE